MSEAQVGHKNPLYGKKHTDQTKQIMSIAKGGSLIFLYSLDLEELKTFSSSRAAAEHFNCCNKTIMRYARSNKIFKDKYILSLKGLSPEAGQGPS